ncbi:MAG: hypothetical protein EOO73_28310 [Myxococcales bacterium]|nr:MAG: hypothetical protein EOO73_28310 [Myxococcales bacterium]
MYMKSVSHYVGSYSLLFAVALAAGCGGAPAEKVGTTSSALTGANGIKADLVFDSQWGQGYCARVIVRNDHPSATTGSWSVSLDVGPGTTFTTWDAVFSGTTGVVTVTPQSGSGAIPPSQSRQFGVCVSTPSPAQPSILAVSSDLPAVPAQGAVITEYKLPPDIDPLVLEGRATELWASFYRPAALEPGRQYPLLVFMHGSHPTCGRQTADRRIDSDRDGSYGDTGECPATHPIVVPSHRGYDYIATDLAERGYFVLSINTNRGINGLRAGSEQDPLYIGARGRLLLRHLERLSQWDAGLIDTPPELGVDLEGRVDFSQVGLFGHSRGGNGVRFAYEEYRRSGSGWPGLIKEPVVFRGIFEIGPTDELANGQRVTPSDVPWNVLLPACDWDQSNLPGLGVFERTFSVAEATPSAKSFYHVWGANHNFYNTEWMTPDANGGGYTGCFNHEPLFDPQAPGSAAQQETGRRAAVSFFTANVGVERDEAAGALFDPAFPLPVDYRVDRGYHPGSSSGVNLLLEDFINPTGTSSYDLANETGGTLTLTHGERRAFVSNIVASPNTFFQTNFAPVGSGFDLTSYDFLDVRADRLGDFTVPGVVSFGIQLVNEDDSRSSPVSIDPYLVLGPPARSNLTLPTARIPLSAFEGAQLGSVRAVRFTFTTPYPEGFGVALANIRATRLTTPAPAGLLRSGG